MEAPAPILAPKVRDLFFDASGNWIPSRYKVMYGGRGGLKTWGFSRVSIILSLRRRIRFLCCRELQTSIEESVHHTLVSQIEMLGLERYFDIQKRVIESRITRSEFIFAGIANNPKKIKSMSAIGIAWIEEAENISDDSWQALIPTIRDKGSEIWAGFNPDLEDSSTSERFLRGQPGYIEKGEPPPGTRILRTTWRDNPWLSDELKAEKDYLARVDPDAYMHVWEGHFRKNSDAQVLKGKCSVEAFEPTVLGWEGPYQGVDWGFSVDPTVLVRCWIFQRCLFIEYEAYGLGVDMHLLSNLFDRVPRAKEFVSRADCARPETISYMQKVGGYPKVVGVEKWKGSVEDGVAFLRQFEKIIIHPRCTHAIEESRLWSYKVDRNTRDVLPDLKDGNDHIWDAVRYALQPLIKNTGSWAFTSV